MKLPGQKIIIIDSKHSSWQWAVETAANKDNAMKFRKKLKKSGRLRRSLLEKSIDGSTPKRANQLRLPIH